MRFLEFQKLMRQYPIFTIQDLKLFFSEENSNTVNKQISSWANQKKIVKLKNGLYVLSSDYTKETLSPEVIAAKLYNPSYISLEYALSYYGMLPEAVFDITSVTSKSTRVFRTAFGIFKYRKIKSLCFYGFSTVKHDRLSFNIATPEKALADFLYLNTHRFKPEFQTWKDLRLQNVKQIDFASLVHFAKCFQSKKLILLIINLKKYATSN